MTGFAHERGVRGLTDEWFTPPEVFAALGVEFDLDPCSPPGGVSWVPAARSLSIHENGLATPWEGRVWLNPPYGTMTGPFLGRLADHGDGIALVFVRSDTAWFQGCAARADALCLIAGRLSFVRSDGVRAGSAAAPSCLLAYGGECADAVRRCGLGLAWTPSSL